MCLCVRAACPDGTWDRYADVSRSEGADSCFKKFSGTNWDAAFASCAALVPGAHLATIKSSAKAGGLLAQLNSWYGNSVYWMGCEQPLNAASAVAGWSWVDGTSASNMNCGGA